MTDARLDQAAQGLLSELADCLEAAVDDTAPYTELLARVEKFRCDTRVRHLLVTLANALTRAREYTRLYQETCPADEKIFAKVYNDLRQIDEALKMATAAGVTAT